MTWLRLWASLVKPLPEGLGASAYISPTREPVFVATMPDHGVLQSPPTG